MCAEGYLETTDYIAITAKLPGDNKALYHHKRTLNLKPSKNMLNMKNQEGLIVPTEWDKSGNIIGINFCIHNEKEYTIEKNNIFLRDLINLVQKQIVLSGKVYEDKKGNSFLKVSSFRIPLTA